MAFTFRRRSNTSDMPAAPLRRPGPIAAALQEQPPLDYVRLVFLGDISAGDRREAPLLDPALAAVVQSADLVIANCASPVVRRPHLSVRGLLGRRHMNAGSLLGIIAAIGVEPERLILSVANQHMLGQGRAGFEESLDTLRSLQVHAVGAAVQAFVQMLRVDTLVVGLVAVSACRRTHRAGERALIHTSDDCDWEAGVAAAPEFLCALPHWGRAAMRRPAKAMLGRAADLARHGVRLAVGHRPSRVQPIELVDRACIAYGLGTFCAASTTGQFAERLGVLLVVDVSTVPWERGQVAGYEAIPFVRLPDRNRERLVSLDALPHSVREHADRHLARLFGTHAGQAP